MHTASDQGILSFTSPNHPVQPLDAVYQCCISLILRSALNEYTVNQNLTWFQHRYSTSLLSLLLHNHIISTRSSPFLFSYSSVYSPGLTRRNSKDKDHFTITSCLSYLHHPSSLYSAEYSFTLKQRKPQINLSSWPQIW